MGFIDRVLASFSLDPPLASALLRAAPAAPGSAAALDAEHRFSLAFAPWRMAKRGDLELLKTYSDNPYLFAPVSMIAEGIAHAANWRLFRTKKGTRARELQLPGGQFQRSEALTGMKDAGLLDEVAQDPLLDLLRHPMPGVPSYDFWEVTAAFFLILGEAFLVKEGRKQPGVGAPSSLNLFSPTQLQRRPDPASPVFEVRTFKGVEQVGVLDTIWTRRINPADFYTGVGVGAGRAIKDELAMDEAMSDTARARFKNRGIPDFILGLLGSGPDMPPPGDDAVKRFATAFGDAHKGTENAGRGHIFGGDFKMQQVSSSLLENQYVEGRTHNRDTSMQTLRMPPGKLGVNENANRSVIEATETLYQSSCVVPVLDRFCAAFQEQLVPDFGSDLVLGYTNPVPADKEFKRSVMIALPLAFTNNDIRKLAGEPPLPPEKGGDDRYVMAKLNEAAQVSGANVPGVDKPKNTDPKNPQKPVDGGPDGTPPPVQ